MTAFRVWAPQANDVTLALPGHPIVDRPMRRQDNGWWWLEVSDAPAGTDYGFRLDGRDALPDPRSPWQPDGVHGLSRTVNHGTFAWTDGSWHGLPLAGSVLYELHVGTFTPAGTFDGVIERLDHLVDLGVDAIELMPVHAFPGRHGWGYDGVDLFAVHEPYGGPDGLRRLVDAAHGRGLAVVLDVVYNHLGPDGDNLGRFGPYFSDRHQTPWGAAVNLDGPGSDEVRQFLIDNAVQWWRDYHCDGLRLDAVHALVDDRAEHLLEQLAAEGDALGQQLGRPLWLIGESDRNDPRQVRAREAGGYGMTAQWDDDVHHAVHAALTGERDGYYVDFGSLATLGKALTDGFIHDGCWSTFRGRSHGRPATDLPGERFVVFLQNHDQVGNRAGGERIAALLDPGLVRIGAALVLLSPYTPLLFMGEEWGATTPWQYFTDHTDPALADAVREGRQMEFADHGWADSRVPDPQDPATAEASQLNWTDLEVEEHAAVLAWYRRLLALRREVPDLRDGRRDRTRVVVDEQSRWLVLYRGAAAVVVNLAAERQSVPVEGTPVEMLASSAQGFGYGEGHVDVDSSAVAVVRLL